MDDTTRKEILMVWQNRKKGNKPILAWEKNSLGLMAYVQALFLARHMRVDLEDYLLLFWKWGVKYDGLDYL